MLWNSRGGTHLVSGIPGDVLFYQFFFFLGLYIRQQGLPWMQRISPRAFWISFALWAVWWGVPYYFGGIFFAKLLTGTFGSVAVLYISQELAKREGLVIRALEIAGKYCMEIYILSDIIKIPLRILLWSKLHMYYTAFVVCSVMANVLPVLLKKYFFDRFPLLNFLFFGEKRR